MSGYGQPGYGHPSPVPPYQPAPRRGMPWWGWALIAFGLLSVLSCVGVLGLVAYVGAKGPDTKVYSGNEVPARFVVSSSDTRSFAPGLTSQSFHSMHRRS